MSLPIYVDSYSGYKANERPIRFHLDHETYDVALVEDRWQEDPNAESQIFMYFGALDGRHK